MIPEKVAVASRPKSASGKATSTKKSKSSPTKIAQASNSSASKKAPAHQSYRVRSGDTLYRIAVEHGVTVAEILAINSVGGVGIHPGDLLKIPPKK